MQCCMIFASSIRSDRSIRQSRGWEKISARRRRCIVVTRSMISIMQTDEAAHLIQRALDRAPTVIDRAHVPYISTQMTRVHHT
jgi:hypothetical protein